MKVLSIARFDSFIKESCDFLNKCQKRGYETSLYLDKNTALSSRQERELLNNYTFQYKKYKTFLEIPLSNFDVIHLSLTGGYIKKFCLYFFELFKDKDKRPIIVSSYPGIILRARYEGYSDRVACDMVCLNSEYDLELFSKFLDRYNISSQDRLFNYGFSIPIINKREHQGYNVVFAEQAVIPNTFTSRAYLAKKLLEYASSNPYKNIIIKPRIKRNEKTLFKCNFHFEDLLKYWKKRIIIPDNIFISYKDINELLGIADELITVSSTVAITSIYNNIKTYFISDFGVNNSFGYDFVRESGCYYPLQDIINGNIDNYSLSKNWIAKNITNNTDTEEKFFNLLKQKVIHHQELDSLRQDFFKVNNEQFIYFKSSKNILEKIYFFLLKTRSKL